MKNGNLKNENLIKELGKKISLWKRRCLKFGYLKFKDFFLKHKDNKFYIFQN